MAGQDQRNPIRQYITTESRARFVPQDVAEPFMHGDKVADTMGRKTRMLDESYVSVPGIGAPPPFVSKPAHMVS